MVSLMVFSLPLDVAVNCVVLCSPPGAHLSVCRDEQLASAKWQDRKTALEELCNLANVPRIQPEPLTEVVILVGGRGWWSLFLAQSLPLRSPRATHLLTLILPCRLARPSTHSMPPSL